MNVLLVCSYNSERSIAGQIIGQEKASRSGLDLNFSSAGLNKSNSIRIKSEMIHALEHLGYKVPEYRPRVLTDEDIQESDLVLCFDQEQKKTLEARTGKPIQTLPEHVCWFPRDIKEPGYYLRTPTAMPSPFFPIVCALTNTRDASLYENVLAVYDKTAKTIEKHIDLLIRKIQTNSSLPCSTQRAS